MRPRYHTLKCHFPAYFYHYSHIAPADKKRDGPADRRHHLNRTNSAAYLSSRLGLGRPEQEARLPVLPLYVEPRPSH